MRIYQNVGQAILYGGLFFLLWHLGSGNSRDDESRYSVSFSRESYDRWWEGGSLHSATVAEWKAASRQNKVATAGDWLASSTWNGKLKPYDDFDRLKQKAYRLANAIDSTLMDVTKEKLGRVLKAEEVAAILIASSKDLDPS